MGTRRTPRLSDSAICGLYRSGLSRFDICLRAGIYDRELIALLSRNGVTMRTPREAITLAETRRRVTLTLNPLRKRRPVCDFP